MPSRSERSAPVPSTPGDAPVADWLRLQAALGLDPARAAALLRRTRSPAAALRAAGASRAGGPSPALGRRAAERARRLGLAAVPLLDARFPEALLALVDPPPLLLVRGDPARLDRPAVAVVGARAATAYGRRVARRLAAELAGAGLVVVSGLARGIDAAAHEGALDAGGVTVAVLAGGIDRIYPPEHRGLAERIAANGALVSEFPLGARPRRGFFPLRNRLISGLALAVVVVEARVRSGSLVTARHGLDQGREVLAVPGPVDAPTSEGTNALLRDGARPVLGAADVLEEIGWVRRAAARRRAASAESAADGAGPPEGDAALLWAELRRAPATRDELAARSGRSPEALAFALLELELAGRVAEDRDGRLHAVGR